jgi:hypothetical protein
MMAITSKGLEVGFPEAITYGRKADFWDLSGKVNIFLFYYFAAIRSDV